MELLFGEGSRKTLKLKALENDRRWCKEMKIIVVAVCPKVIIWSYTKNENQAAYLQYLPIKLLFNKSFLYEDLI